MVPTVERGLRLVDFWSIETAGESPSMKSTSGLSIWPRNCLAYADSDSTYRRWPSAKMVSKARLDLPEPDSPVNTIMASLGRSSETSLRLCSRAPRTTSRSATVRSVSPGLGGEIEGENGACKARAQWYLGPLTFLRRSGSGRPSGHGDPAAVSPSIQSGSWGPIFPAIGREG